MAQHMTPSAGSPLPQELRACIEVCGECANLCWQTLDILLDKGGQRASRDNVVLLLDCAQMCRTAADAMLRASPRHDKVCGLCAELCDACAKLCEGFDEPQIRGCAEVCRRCAESCRAMSLAHAS